MMMMITTTESQYLTDSGLLCSAGQVMVETKNNTTKQITSSMLQLADLAGSEQAKRTGAQGVQLVEAQNINRCALECGIHVSASASSP